MKKNNVLYPLLGLRVHLNRCLPMKLMTLLVFVFSIPAFSAAYSQEGSVSFSAENMRVEEIIKHVRSISGYKFLFNHEELRTAGTKSVKFANTPIREVMNEVLRGTNLTYRLEKDVIVIYPIVVTARDSVQKSETVKGVVKDEKGATLPGVTVLLKGTTIGVTTDEDGKFSLTIPESPNAEFLFSFVGMIPQTILYRNMPKGDWTVVMKEEVMEVDEVVVTGLLTRKKSGFAGTTTMITKQELAKVSTGNIFTTISAIDAGFKINENNLDGSNPNVLPDFTIRGKGSFQNGSTTPIFILDGFEITLERMMDLDEEDIASVTILKDAASTAIYGSRGSNGVVVITSVKPQEGKLRVSCRVGMNFEVPDLTSYNLLNAKQKLELEKMAGLFEADKNSKSYWLEQDNLNKEYNLKLKNVQEGVNTYWLSQPLRTGMNGDYGLSLSGGDVAFRYSLNASYKMIKGVMKGSDRSNFNGTLTISYLYKNFQFSNSVSVGANRGNESMYGSFSAYAELNPYYTPYDADGELVKSFPAGGGEARGPKNPLYDASTSSYAYSNYVDLRNNTSVEWSPLESLKVGLRFGYSYNTEEQHDYKSSDHSMFMMVTDPMAKGTYDYGTTKSTMYNLALNLSYAKVLGDHSVFVGFNGTVSETNSRSYSIGTEGFMHDRFDFLSMGASYSGTNPGGFESTSRSLGVTVNVNYSWKHSLFIDASYRLDGASAFGPYSRFRPFYTVGAGWTASSLKFIQDKAGWINLLRFKYNYGVTGSLPFQVYDAITTFNYDVNSRYVGKLGASIFGFGNPNLSWQYTYSHNFGVELNVFQGLITANLNLYTRLTEGSISNSVLPPSHGYTSYKENQGDIRNKGYDFSVSLRLLNDMQRRINWNIRASFQHNKNILVRLSPAMKAYSEQIQARDIGNQAPAFLYREGESMDALYVVKSLGIDPATGRELFQKRNGTVSYEYSNSDKVAIGLSQPKVTGNFSTTIRYKNLNVSMAFNVRLGGQKYNTTLVQKVENANIKNNVDKRVFSERWSGPDHYAKYKGWNEKNTNGQSSRFMQDESTIKCGTFNVSYTLNSKWIKQRMKMSAVSFALNTTDLFQISTVKLERGTSYPFARRISTRISFNF